MLKRGELGQVSFIVRIKQALFDNVIHIQDGLTELPAKIRTCGFEQVGGDCLAGSGKVAVVGNVLGYFKRRANVLEARGNVVE